jgi:hypothetical protein
MEYPGILDPNCLILYVVKTKSCTASDGKTIDLVSCKLKKQFLVDYLYIQLYLI